MSNEKLCICVSNMWNDSFPSVCIKEGVYIYIYIFIYIYIYIYKYIILIECIIAQFSGKDPHRKKQ